MISSLTNRNGYLGAGNENEYDYDFKIFSEDDLLVAIRNSDNVEEILELDNDYTVSGVGDEEGGSITLVSDGQAWLDADGDLRSGYTISIRRVRSIKQLTDIANQGAFYAKTHEDVFDKLTMVDQQQQDELDRSMKLPETFDPEDFSAELPAPVAGTLLGWNDAETALENKTTASSLVGVTAFGLSLVDDANAAAARATLDVSQAINSLTSETDPAVNDLLPLRDVSEPADNKVTIGNLFKLLSSLSRVGQFSNLGIVAATTTNSNDSIKVQGAAAALSASNPLSAALPHSTTAGLVAVLAATADITTKITGAHFGLGTKGDFTDVEIRVYFINDGSGTLKVGYSIQGGLRTIVSTNTSATPTDITTVSKMLVNSALAVGTWPCIEVGWIMGSFDDTGGAAEDLWAMSTSLGKIGVGIPVKHVTDWESWTPTGTWNTNTTYTGRKRRVGDCKEYEVTVSVSGAPNSTALQITLPTGDVVDSSKLCGTARPARLGHVYGDDYFTGAWAGLVEYNSITTVGLFCIRTASSDNTAVADVTEARPQTFASGDKVNARFTVPLLGLSAN